MKPNMLLLLIGLFLLLTACGNSDVAPTVTQTAVPSATMVPSLTPTITPTRTPKPTSTVTPIPWQSYHMTITLRIGGIGKLWMPVPHGWDNIGMTNFELIDISPTPDDLYEDSQKNLIAFWNAGYRGTTEYSISFNADFAPIKYEVNPDAIGKYDIASLDYQKYTKPSKLIQSSNDVIIQRAYYIVGNETNPYLQARLIHKWVSNNIKGGEAIDAITTLETRQGDCASHSHLFVALLRALGIPARNVGGLHTGYSGIFSNGEAKGGHADSRTLYTHVWSEFYIPNYGWIQSDTSAGLQNFAEINEPRLVLFRGEDIELGHGYPLTTVSWFHSPQTNIIGGSSPSTQTWGESLKLIVEKVP